MLKENAERETQYQQMINQLSINVVKSSANDVSSLLERIQKNPDLRRQLVESLLLGAVGA